MDDQGTNRAGGGMRYCKLRIAWSVGWGILCMLLFVLWVRSAHISDNAQSSLFGLQKVSLHSVHRSLSVVAYFGDAGEFADRIHSAPLNKLPGHVFISTWGFGSSPGLGPTPSNQYFVAVPHWLPVLVAVAFSTL